MAGTLFHPFRALGYVTANVPFAVQRRGRNTFLTVSAGKAWQLYNCAKLTLIFVGQPVRAPLPPRQDALPCRAALALRRRLLCPPQLERSITALASKDDFTFAAYGPHVAVFRRRARPRRPWARNAAPVGLGLLTLPLRGAGRTASAPGTARAATWWRCSRWVISCSRCRPTGW